jgi:His/Glu/Gln/Arg/opine family amino acid ABC transporter permease subunit
MTCTALSNSRTRVSAVSSEFLAILAALRINVMLSALAATLAICLATVGAIFRLSNFRALRVVGTLYVELFRSIPQVALLLLFFFGLGAVQWLPHVSAFWVAVVALGVSEGAYTTEVYRSAIKSIPAGQWGAGSSLGLTRLQVYKHVILPQALWPALPPTVNMIVYTVKASALASLITVPEVMQTTNGFVFASASSLPFYLMATVAFLIVTVPLAYVGRFLESRNARVRGQIA